MNFVAKHSCAVGFFVGCVVACGVDGNDDGNNDDDNDVDVDGACDLAAEFSGCPECDDGIVTCTYEGASATENSCGGCQARGALYQQLCDADVDADAADIEADTVCVADG
jgi:hypothetical protein